MAIVSISPCRSWPGTPQPDVVISAVGLERSNVHKQSRERQEHGIVSETGKRSGGRRRPWRARQYQHSVSSKVPYSSAHVRVRARRKSGDDPRITERNRRLPHVYRILHAK